MTAHIGRSLFAKTPPIIAGLFIILMVIMWIILAITIPGDVSSDLIPWVISSVVNSLLAFLILSRHPGHVIGWLFLAISFFTGLVFTLNWLQFTPETNISSDLARAMVLFVGELAWIFALFAPMTLVLQFFPNGRLPSRRWWPLPIITVIAMLLLAAGFVVEPLAVGENQEIVNILEILSTIWFVTAIFGSLAAVVVRYRRSQGAERLQMKWLVYVAVVGILLMFLLVLLLDDESPIIGFYTSSLPTILAISIGIAILRYRLYDIDVIIRRTLQYGIVTAILALVYFGLVIVFQSAFTAVGDQQSGFFIVLSTLVIAALFNPVRKRVQNAVDRRFYRQKYQAEQILADFAAVARDEVDLDQIAAALMDVVEETMQPERASLSLFNRESE